MKLAPVAALLCAGVLSAQPHSPSTWSAKSAAGYLDGRMAWWLTWNTAARDHETSCVS
jgi:hypothetical protein